MCHIRMDGVPPFGTPWLPSSDPCPIPEWSAPLYPFLETPGFLLCPKPRPHTHFSGGEGLDWNISQNLFLIPIMAGSALRSFMGGFPTGNGGNRTEIYDGRVVDVGFPVNGVVPTMLYSRYFLNGISLPPLFLLSPPTSLSRHLHGPVLIKMAGTYLRHPVGSTKAICMTALRKL